jgi:hypothetical protein
MREVTAESAWRFISRLQQYFSKMRITRIASGCLTRTRGFRRRMCVSCVAAVLLSFISPGFRASIDSSETKPVLTVEQYEAELDRLSSAVSKFPENTDGTGALRESLSSGWVVTADGARFEISAEWLKGSLNDIEESLTEWKKRCDGSSGVVQKVCSERVTEENLKEWKKLCEGSAGKPQGLCGEHGVLESLRGWRMRCEELAAQLRESRREAARLSGTTQPTDESNARARLHQILSSREYQSVRSESWLSRIWDQLGRWIDWILDHTIGRIVESGPARTLILWTLIIGVVLVIAIWVVRLLMEIGRAHV